MTTTISSNTYSNTTSPHTNPSAPYAAILDFWFTEITPAAWWRVDKDFDALVTNRFGTLHAQVCAGELYTWRTDADNLSCAKGRLAEIIVLDQFSRNIYRGTPGAFAADPMALALAQEALSWGALDSLSEMERSFLLMPFMHSESKIIHTLAQTLFQEHAVPNNFEFELKHKAIIDRFGRYPHRNSILGRTSSAEETAFLLEPGSAF